MGITTAGWLLVTFLTKPTDRETLRNFYRLVHPGGPGWKKVVQEAEAEGNPIEEVDPLGWDVPWGILCMFLGVVVVYSMLFAVGQWIYDNTLLGSVFTVIALVSGFLLMKAWSRLRTQPEKVEST